MPYAHANHGCGEKVWIAYCAQSDAYLNPAFCVSCNTKFFPRVVYFNEPDDGTIAANPLPDTTPDEP